MIVIKTLIKKKECENIDGKYTIIGNHIGEDNLKKMRINIDERELLGAINKYNNMHDTVVRSIIHLIQKTKVGNTVKAGHNSW